MEFVIRFSKLIALEGDLYDGQTSLFFEQLQQQHVLQKGDFFTFVSHTLYH